ncbi:MAG: MoaD/ThiS family protein [Pirellulaceae bacterium]|nr:MoaD/ThiS family protein [Pirellulaceae bacterium]
MPRVFLPPALRSLAGGQESLEMPGSTVREILAELERRHPGVQAGLCQGDGLRPGLAVCVGGAVSTLGLLQPVGPDDEVHFLPAIGGG